MIRLRAWACVTLLVLWPLAARAQPPQQGRISSTTCPGSGCVLLGVTNQGAAAIQIVGTFDATLLFEGSIDGLNFVALRATIIGTGVPGNSTTTTGIFVANVAGLNQIRVRASIYTSGEALVHLQYASSGDSGANSVGIDGVTLTDQRMRTSALVENTSGVTPSRNDAMVEGCKAVGADATDCYPLLFGGSASTAVPGAAASDGLAIRAWLSRNGTLHVMSTAGTATLANVADTATSTALIAANTARLHAKCHNDSTVVLYINYGATASATAFTEKVEPGGSWYMEWPTYTGVVNGIWASDASGSARCTELTQ